MTSSEIMTVIKVQFLITHGWEYNEYADEWTKEGRTHKVQERGNCRCGRCSSTRDSPDFDLDMAYDKEKDFVDNAVAHVMSV